MNKKRVVVVIPARMGASRFPGKPLAKILGLPMVEHVRRRVLLSSLVNDVYVATCDQEIMDAVKEYGGKAIMTANTHERCTERVEEASRSIEADIIVIAQGDEPLFMPEIIDPLIAPLLSSNEVYCTSLLSHIKNMADLSQIDIVKAVLNQKEDVMYFSRSPIPYFRVNNNAICYRQTGISSFTADFLKKFSELAPTQLEIAESIDFLRILEHGYPIRGVVFDQETFGVDREEHIQTIEKIIKTDPIQKKYYEKIIKL